MNQAIEHARRTTQEAVRRIHRLSPRAQPGRSMPVERCLHAAQRAERYLMASGLNGSLRRDLIRETLKRLKSAPERAGQDDLVAFVMQSLSSVIAERYGSHNGGYPNPWPKDLTAWRLRIWLEGNNKNACRPEESPAYAQETDERQFILRAIPDVDRVSMVPERLDRQPPRRWVRRLKRLAAIKSWLPARVLRLVVVF